MSVWHDRIKHDVLIPSIIRWDAHVFTSSRKWEVRFCHENIPLLSIAILCSSSTKNCCSVWFTANFYILTLEWNKQDKNKDVCSACNRRVWLLGWRRKRYLLLRSDVDLLETCRIGKLWGRAIYQWHITKPQMPKKIWDLSEKNILSSLIFNLVKFLLNQNEKYLSISELRRGIKKQPISENRLWLVIVVDNPFKREM